MKNILDRLVYYIIKSLFLIFQKIESRKHDCYYTWIDSTFDAL